MLELLKNYEIKDILLFIVLLALAFKGVVSYLKWGSDFFNQKYNKKKKIEDTHRLLKTVATTQEQINDKLNTMSNTINTLIESDKDDIKAWITEKHHYFCYVKKYIDDYHLDCIEKRYKHYKDEGGNSFIEGFMQEIRALPKVANLKDEDNIE